MLADLVGTKGTKDYSFVSKSKLVDHYEKSLGATHVGGFKMVIFPKPAFQLIKQFYPHLVK